ncbi:MAG: hypothetical protein ACK533_09870, partial [Planctomycetota bacterium]
MAALPETPRFQNPLRAVPSVLGLVARLAPLRGRLRADANPLDLEALLRLDPLAVRSALRAVA